jgi:hypothetical protein
MEKVYERTKLTLHQTDLRENEKAAIQCIQELQISHFLVPGQVANCQYLLN